MLSFPRSIRSFLRSGTAGIGAFFLAISALEYNELTHYRAQAALTPIVINGTLRVKGKNLTISKHDQVLVECPIAACGFPGVYTYSGSEVQAHFRGSAIVRIQTVGVSIDAFIMEEQSRVTKLKRDLWMSAISALALLILSVLPKVAPNPAFQRTASGGR